MSDEPKKTKSKGKSGDVAKWAGVGIGSAAVAAALLYYNRDKVVEAVKGKPKPVEHED